MEPIWTHKLLYVEMEVDVGFTDSLDADFSIPSLGRECRGMLGRPHLTSGSKCQHTFGRANNINVHMTRHHRDINTGVSRPKET